MERRADTLAKARAISDAAEAEARDLTDEENQQFSAYMKTAESVKAAIDQEQALIDAEKTLQVPDNAVITGGEPVVMKDEQRGFQSFGEYCTAVFRAGTHGEVDQRLIVAAAPSTYGNEGTGADGGFAMPPQYSRDIWDLSLEEDSLVPLTDNTPIQSNSMVFPSDETTPWGTDGVRAYWEDEAAAATATKPAIKPNTMRLKKLLALIPLTDELLADSSGMPAYVNRKGSESIRYKTNDAIINGSGTGRPKGTRNSGAVVTQAKETSQTADTINATNVVKMFSRNLRPGRAVWLVNPDAFPQLPLMTIGDQPVYTGPSGLRNAPGGLLLGRPVIMSDLCQTLGDQGDIQFIDFGNYRTITKSGGIQTATSMHLYFDADAVAFRLTFRIDGQNILSAAVTPPNSSVTRSNIVELAARA